MNDAEVYWAARKLQDNPFGNHHFILIYLPEDKALLQTEAKKVPQMNIRYVTFGGFSNSAGKMVALAKEWSDFNSVGAHHNPKFHGSASTLQKNKVSPPSGGGLTFAWQIEKLALSYERNSKQSAVQYDLSDANCASWVNTLFKVAGVPLSERIRCGEFSGVDWGEEDLIDETMFK